MSRTKKTVILFTVLAVVAINLLLLFRMHLSDESVRRRVEDALRQALKCKVDIGSAEASLTGLLQLNDVRMYLPGQERGEPAFSCEQIMVDCSLFRLLSGKGGIDEVEVMRPRARISPALVDLVSSLPTGKEPADGRWIPKKLSLNSGALHFDSGMLYSNSPPVLLSDVQIDASASSFSGSGIGFRGSARQTIAGLVKIDGEVRMLPKTLSLNAELEQIDVLGSFRNLLPAHLQHGWDDVSLRGQVGVTLQMLYAWGDKRQMQQKIVARPANCSVTIKDFPLPVRQLSGVVESDGHSLRIVRLIGRYNGGTIEVNRGTIDKTLIDIEVLGRGLPLDQRMKEALPPDVLNIWDDLTITGGLADVVYRLMVHRPDGIPHAEHSLDIQVREVSGSYKEHPYPVKSISGRIRVESQKWIEKKLGYVTLDLTGTAGSGNVSISGRVPLAPNPKWGDVPQRDARLEDAAERLRPDLAIMARDVLINYTGRRAIPPDVLDVVDLFEPEGKVDVDILLKFENDKKLEVTSRKVIVGLRGNTVSLDELPYPVVELTGRIEWDGELIKLVDLKGLSNKAVVNITGLIDPHDRSANPRRDIFVAAQDVQLDDRSIEALPPEVCGVVASLCPEGKVNLSAHLKLLGDDRLATVPQWVKVELLGVRARADAFPYQMKDITGRVEWRDGNVKFVGVRGFADEAEVSIAGEVKIGAHEGADAIDTHNVVVTARRVPLDDRLRMALEEQHREVWDEFYPSGHVNVVCMLRLGGDEGEQVVRKIIIDLDHCEAEYGGFPYPLERITGRIVFDGGRVLAENVTGYSGTGLVRINGRLYTDADENAETAHVNRLHVHAWGVPFDMSLKHALPTESMDVLGKLDNAGNIDASLHLAWENESSMRITRGSTITTRGLMFRTFPMPDITFALTVDDDTISLGEMAGTFYGGTVKGKANYARKDEAFDMQLSAYNVDIKQFNTDKGLIDQDVRGMLTSTLSLKGQGAKTDALCGSAEIDINSGQLANIPFFAKLVMELINLKWPGGNAITDASMNCKLEDGKIEFDEIILTGTSVPITGAGSITLDGNIDLLFNTSRKSREGLLASIPLVGPLMNDIVTGVRNFIIQVRVTGTLSKPEPRAQPFNPIVSPFNSFVKLIFGSPSSEKKPEKQ